MNQVYNEESIGISKRQSLKIKKQNRNPTTNIITIFVKSLHQETPRKFKVAPYQKLIFLKRKVSAVEKLIQIDFRLLYNNKPLDPRKRVKASGLKEGSYIEIKFGQTDDGPIKNLSSKVLKKVEEKLVIKPEIKKKIQSYVAKTDHHSKELLDVFAVKIKPGFIHGNKSIKEGIWVGRKGLGGSQYTLPGIPSSQCVIIQGIIYKVSWKILKGFSTKFCEVGYIDSNPEFQGYEWFSFPEQVFKPSDEIFQYATTRKVENNLMNYQTYVMDLIHFSTKNKDKNLIKGMLKNIIESECRPLKHILDGIKTFFTSQFE